MWIFTQTGFLSVVEYREELDPSVGSPSAAPSDALLVRARMRDDLLDLAGFAAGEGQAPVVGEDSEADYRWRMVVPRGTFAEWLAGQVRSIDYSSHFKEVVAERAAWHPSRYRAMLDVWTAMYRLQLPRPGVLWGRN